jgi:uncharacterized integral membrane protein
MKKLSVFLAFSLLLILASLIFVLQNNTILVQIKFFAWSLSNVPLGFLVIISLLVGVIIIWLVSLVLYIVSVTKSRKLLHESEEKVFKLEEDKKHLGEEIEKLKLELSQESHKVNESQTELKKSNDENNNNKEDKII